MSRCYETDALLDAIFVGRDLTNAQGVHAGGCSECARALAQARRFELELHQVGLQLAPDPMPEAADTSPPWTPVERRTSTVIRRLLGGAAAAVVLALAAFAGGQSLGTLFGPDSSLPSNSGSITAGAAAALVGVERDDVLLTEDGALAIRDLGLSMELVLVRQTADGLRQFVADTTPPTAGDTAFSTLTCSEDAELRRTHYVWGRWDELERIEGPGDFVITDENHLIFAFDPASLPGSQMVVFERQGNMQFGLDANAARREPCLSVTADPNVEIRRPDAMRCGDWEDLILDEKGVVTEALVTDEMLPAVREVQQMPLAAGRDELLSAASGSIEKVCQGSEDRRPLTQVVMDLYVSSRAP